MVFAGKALNPRGRLASYGGLSVEVARNGRVETGKAAGSRLPFKCS